MIKKLAMGFGLAAAGALAATFTAPVAQAQPVPEYAPATSVEKKVEAHGITAAEFKQLSRNHSSAAPLPGWDVPFAMSYTIDASCSADAGAIRQGATAWNQLSEGGGTPVSCVGDYITDCGGGSNVVGCNYGSGQRITLFMGGVNDDALLAAHEFGHDWYGHSSFQCAGWGSPEEVMSPTICNAPSARGGPVAVGQM